MSRLLSRVRAVFEEYPRQFWLLVGASFIDMSGNALIFPFFAMFLTDHFDISMTQVGVIFAIYAVAGVIGSTIGGALTDRFGRKPMALTALVTSALGNFSLPFIPSVEFMYLLGGTLGVVGSIGGPAWQAMMADLLPEEKRTEGFGIIRILFNLAVTFGPLIGGLLAGVSYVLLFSIDALTSLITFSILLIFLRETRPQTQKTEDGANESILQTFKGYRQVLQDRAYVTFIVLGVIVWLMYMQMNTTLAVFLRDEHGIKPQGFGILIGINALMVVLMQFSVTRWVRQRGWPQLLVIALGTLLYAIGFSMFGFVTGFAMFIVAMVIITIGEMFASPTAQAMAANFAPEHMRGRYMAIFGFTYAIASGMGTWLAGHVINYLGFDWVWYLAGILGGVATVGYILMQKAVEIPEQKRESEQVVIADPAL